MSPSNKPSNGVAETVKTMVYAVLIAVFVRTVAFEPFNIPSGSMIPSLLIGDYVFVSKYSYGYSRYSLPLSLPLFSGRVFGRVPQRGDVVVFRLPTDNRTDYIKRLIGLPGDRIQMIGGRLHVNGQTVERRQIDDYIDRNLNGNLTRAPQYLESLPEGRIHPIQELSGDDGPMDNTPEYVVPPDHYFMMGDNRDNSQDSRYLSQVGYVPAENLVGKAQVIFFSVDGSASIWEIWKWPTAIRWNRIFDAVD